MALLPAFRALSLIIYRIYLFTYLFQEVPINIINNFLGLAMKVAIWRGWSMSIHSESMHAFAIVSQCRLTSLGAGSEEARWQCCSLPLVCHVYYLRKQNFCIENIALIFISVVVCDKKLQQFRKLQRKRSKSHKTGKKEKRLPQGLRKWIGVTRRCRQW